LDLAEEELRWKCELDQIGLGASSCKVFIGPSGEALLIGGVAADCKMFEKIEFKGEEIASFKGILFSACFAKE
jgi:hypothetical protein